MVSSVQTCNFFVSYHDPSSFFFVRHTKTLETKEQRKEMKVKHPGSAVNKMP